MGHSNLTEVSDSTRWYKSVIAGSVSGLLVRFVISPLDVMKIRLQLERNTKNNTSVPATHIAKSLLRDEGILALWKGNLPAEVMYLVYGGVQFSSYSALKKYIANQRYLHVNKDINSLVSGGVSGCAATVISYPFDTLRTRLAADKRKGFHKFAETIRRIYANESIAGFYGGLKPTIYQIFVHTGLSFWSYGKLRDFQATYNIQKDSFVVPLSGFAAGTFAKAVTFPLDSLKRRLQIKGSGNLVLQLDYLYLVAYSDLYNSKNLLKIWTKIVQVEGFLSLYRGFGIAILKSGPASALSFTIYEYCMKLLA